MCPSFNDDKGCWTLASGERHYCIGLGWIDSRKHSTRQTLAGPIDDIQTNAYERRIRYEEDYINERNVNSVLNIKRFNLTCLVYLFEIYNLQGDFDTVPIV